MDKHLNSEPPISIYTPASQLSDPRRLLQNMRRDFVASRELAWRLLIRNISSRYRQTILGFTWALLPPILTTVVFVFLRKSGYFSVGRTDVPYEIFVLTGVILWQVFADALNAPMRMVSQSVSMLTKINFPREALILAGIGEVIFGLVIRLALLAMALIWFQVPVPSSVVWVPFGILALIAFGISVGLALTPLSVLYHDVDHGLPLLLTMWMFLTPVLFPAPTSWPASLTMILNPVGPLIVTTRSWLLTGATEFLAQFLVVSGLTVAFLLCGWIIYRLALPILIERLSS
jgi:lipopolysaccharide transport system permease protein